MHLQLQFEDSEKKRIKAEQLRQELKHKKQWDDMRARNEAALKELEQLQVILNIEMKPVAVQLKH